MKAKLTIADFQAAAKRLNVEVAAIRAVTAVESDGSGFDENGRCIIRFEPHLFSRKTKGIYDKSHPTISFPKRKNGYPKSVNHSWQLFKLAASLNPTAAVASTSWGRFQVLGSNYLSSGCDTLSEFVRRMENSEQDQLDMFCSLILDWGLDDELRDHRWNDFARMYNGPGYRDTGYDVKLPRAYLQYA